MENCMLPEQVVFNILLWLPVISLLRFRSVCKTWCSIIDSFYFINQHLLHPKDDNNYGSLIMRDRELADWFVLSGHQFEERVNLDLSAHLPLHEYDYSNFIKYGYYIEDTTWERPALVASCNGIICLSCERPVGRVRVALWNPATKKLACLPEPTNLSEENACIVVGFGYAVKTNDYKVVRIAEFRNPDLSTAYSLVEAYSLQTDSWRNIDIDLPAGPCALPFITTYWNGYFCWLLRLPKGYDPPANFSILSFDLSNDVFKTIQLPNAISTKMCEPYLTMTRDCIACIDSVLPLGSQHGHFDIWVLNEYGVKESWTKLYTIRLIGTFSFLCLEGFSENGKFLLLHNQIGPGFELGLCDPKTQEIKNLQAQFTDVAVYKESLVPVKRKGLLASQQE